MNNLEATIITQAQFIAGLQNQVEQAQGSLAGKNEEIQKLRLKITEIQNEPSTKQDRTEITPEMVSAGVRDFYDFLPDAQIGTDAEAELVTRIFRTMCRASR